VSTTAVRMDIDTLAINTIRGLCMDKVQKANSGHPGTPMGIAPVAYTLWQRFLRFDPADPIWPTFGASAPLKQLLIKPGFTPDRVAEVARERVAAARR
jgi:transketolase